MPLPAVPIGVVCVPGFVMSGFRPVLPAVPVVVDGFMVMPGPAFTAPLPLPPVAAPGCVFAPVGPVTVAPGLPVVFEVELQPLPALPEATHSDDNTNILTIRNDDTMPTLSSIGGLRA